MIIEFNFKSQIATSREQSERLLALGLKKGTADCALLPLTDKVTSVLVKPSTKDIKNTIPAWSLHRLIELAYGNWKEDIAPIYLGNAYDMLVGRIEFQVKQEKFNKEYLV